ncbi:hypothetical protein HMPREF1624_07471 [Sporothrix schenckii ATCC 58251]|uniref:Transcriptional coactivator HFI1/ADA1 n=1 Tax=Sporothrix schenckii (strain ATCC 58251 / de Perez 2211183) TaxID=1391915 RepID=U7PM01_SPOS1|nr:hypothetical protein HMPREF1624_07471 [Sporothrix schenckii ATCC 58251]
MPDINPADLSRPAVSLSTPILSNKSITVSSSLKPSKAGQSIPPRIELEQAYTSLRMAVGNEQWKIYKTATTQFLIGRLNQAEYSNIVDPILYSPNGEREHLHNQLISAIYGNVTRDLPDPGLAPWVSANDKPSSGLGSKASGNDANERRIKGEVMLLPSKDRRRIKDVVNNEKFDPYDALASVFTDQQRMKFPRPMDAAPASASGGINRMNLDLEIRKRFAQPLAVESGEFPDTSNIESRMLPFCYEAGLVSGHASDAAQFMSIATETFVKEVLSSVFSRTRSDGPGEYGSAGFGGSNWVQTRKYRRQLAREEERSLLGEIQRDKMGLLPIEAKKASERGPLGVAEFRLALEMGDCGLTQFPIVGHSLMASYREGELENWDDFTWIDGMDPTPYVNSLESSLPSLLPAANVNGAVSAAAGAGEAAGGATAGGAGGAGGGAAMVKTGSSAGAAAAVDGIHLKTGQPNGVDYAELMELDDNDDIPWDGADLGESDLLGGVLDSVLAVG